MVYHGGLDSKIREFNGLLGGVEVHFQTFDEIALEGQEYDTIQAYVQKAKENDIDLMMHAPFIVDRDPENGKLFNFDFKWFVVPNEYQEQADGTQKPIVASPDGSVILNARETDSFEMYDTIQLADKLGINLLTVHVTKPEVMLNDKEWAQYDEYISDLVHFIHTTNSNVDLCVETGGATWDQLLSLNKKYGTLINMDTAHYFLDMMHLGMTAEEANKDTVTKFKQYRDIIGQVHLTQTVKGQDLHKGIYEEGALTCNEEIIRIISEDQLQGLDKLCMVESKADIENFYQVAKALRHSDDETEKFLVISMGLPATGKSTTLNLIQKVLGVDVLESDAIRDEYENQQFSFVTMNPEKDKDVVYDEMNERAEKRFAHGTGVIMDATYHLKDRREKIKGLLEQNDVEELYIFELESDEKDIENRFNLRKNQINHAKAEGKSIPKKVHELEIYKNLEAAAEPFELAEFPNAHVVHYNTSTRTIDVYNSDFTTEVMLMNIRNDVRERLGQNLKINYR